MKKYTMFENYPDVVEVDDLRKMLGGISKKLAYRLLAEQEIRSVRVGRSYKIPKVCIIEYLMGEEMCQIKISGQCICPGNQFLKSRMVVCHIIVEKSSGFSPLGV